jgi:hypothetical protein
MRKESEKMKILLDKGAYMPTRAYETDKIYCSAYEASKRTSATSSAISASCRDKSRLRKSGGYHWEFVEVE